MTHTPFNHPAFDLVHKKNKLERSLAKALFDAVDANKLELANLQSTAKELWDSLQAIDSEEELKKFTDNLGQKFHFLSPLTTKHHQNDPKEKEMMDKLSSFISNQAD